MNKDKSATMPTLKKLYLDKIIPDMMEEFSLKNKHQVPVLSKINVNMGIGQGSKDIELINAAMDQLASIVGQRPAMTRARKAISNFKIRAGMPLGCKVTLRGKRMYEFLERLINIALPRIRDFRGVSNTSFDDSGNYTMGIQEQIIFPEVNLDKAKVVQGMNISFVWKSAVDSDQAYRVLESFGMPFKKG